MEDTLNRRGIFFKKLAVADLEFFAARAERLASRGPALAINAPVAEAVLPRAAQRRGQWKVQLRPYPDGASEQFDLSRSVDWQLSGRATVEAHSSAVDDWFAVQYEVSPDGSVSFLWRVVTLERQQAFWRRIEESVTWHLVARMAHFAEVHPEYAAISALLESASAIEIGEPPEPASAEPEPELVEAPTEASIVPSSTPEFSETTLRLSDGAILQYHYYVARLPVFSVRMRAPAPAPVESEPSPPEEPKPVPTSAPDVDTILNLDKAQPPILLRESPAMPPKREMPAAAAREISPASEPPPSRSENRWTRTLSASVLGLIVLAAVSAKNSDLNALACEKFGFHCAGLQQAEIAAPSAIAPTAALPDEPIHTASVPTTLPAHAEPAPAAIVKPPSEAIAAPQVDEVVWGFLKDTKDSDQLRNFLSQFPASPYRAPALTRLAALEPKVTECDLLAAHPLDLLKNPKVTGVKLQFLNTALATPACERAVEDYPEAVRFPLQLGRGYEKAKKYREAHQWYAKAAERGNVQAMHNLGFQYATGQGVARDYVAARKWFDKAAVLGSTAAMFHLGQLYANGFGVARDYVEARRWFTQASDNGLPLAMTALGDLYANGFGVERDYAEARQWYRKAAQLGSAEGMYNLGMLQEKGRGGPRDYGEARKWYAKAADIGNEEAKRSLARLRR